MADERATHEDPQIQDAARAVRLAKQACEASQHQIPTALDTLSVAYASAGQFDEAVQTVRQAIQLAQQRNQSLLVTQLQSRLALFETRQPFVEKALEAAQKQVD